MIWNIVLYGFAFVGLVGTLDVWVFKGRIGTTMSAGLAKLGL